MKFIESIFGILFEYQVEVITYLILFNKMFYFEYINQIIQECPKSQIWYFDEEIYISSFFKRNQLELVYLNRICFLSFLYLFNFNMSSIIFCLWFASQTTNSRSCKFAISIFCKCCLYYITLHYYNFSNISWLISHRFEIWQFWWTYKNTIR